MDIGSNSIMRYFYSDTLDQIAMDLYINFQQEPEKEERGKIFQLLVEIKTIIIRYRAFPNKEILEAIDYLQGTGEKKELIPNTFRLRLIAIGYNFDPQDFYLYRHVEK